MFKTYEEQSKINKYEKMKPNLKPYKKRILQDGTNSLSQSWLENTMWSKWKKLCQQEELNRECLDPWADM